MSDSHPNPPCSLEMLPPCLAGAAGGAPQIMVVAGEASGDVYGADVVHRLAEIDPTLRFFGMGGDRMAACNVEILHHIKEVSVMGFAEVVSRIPKLYRTFRQLVDEAERRQPTAIVLIDFPDFNLRLAAKLKEVCDAKILYYIGPTVWAWRPGRVEQIKKSIDKMIVIFPFEEPIYRDAGVEVEFVGHPLVGTVKTQIESGTAFRDKFGIGPDARLVGLLPGSRTKEVEHILPGLLKAADKIAVAATAPCEFAIGVADSIDRAQVEPIVARHLAAGGTSVHIVERATPDLMKHADVLLVASGTAPLEAAILGTPQVVVYRTTPLTFGIASRLVTVAHVCMVNLILEQRAVPELIQHDFTPERVAAEALLLLTDADARKAQETAFVELRRRLGASGASKRAARAILSGAGLEAARVDRPGPEEDRPANGAV